MELGVDACALNAEDQNFAHTIVQYVYLHHFYSLIEWVEFVLNNCNVNIWIARDRHGNTPLQLLEWAGRGFLKSGWEEPWVDDFKDAWPRLINQIQDRIGAELKQED